MLFTSSRFTQNVTKGARHKIAVEIEKLRSRPNDLAKLAKQLNGVADVRGVLGELRNVLSTPIKLSATFCLLIGKIQNVDDVPADDLAAKIVIVFRKGKTAHSTFHGLHGRAIDIIIQCFGLLY